MDRPAAPPATETSAAASAGPGGPVAGRIAVLFVLYFVQGLPFGFQVSALPVYLRQAGVSLTTIGLAGALSLPWMLKALWAPAVDRWSWRRVGRRRSWILPMQAGLAFACGAAAFFRPDADLPVLLGLVLCMNLFAATMDIAVDGLAVDVLEVRHLGYGNIAQDGSSLGLVHRDLSPNNVRLSWNGAVKLSDFGMAKASAGSNAGVSECYGTPGYTSPEQVRGSALDRRSDLFVVGVIFYELLTGTRLFVRENRVRVDFAVLQQRIAPLRELQPDLPADVEALTTQLLSREREQFRASASSGPRARMR